MTAERVLGTLFGPAPVLGCSSNPGNAAGIDERSHVQEASRWGMRSRFQVGELRDKRPELRQMLNGKNKMEKFDR
jgi:hypothetical protein